MLFYVIIFLSTISMNKDEYIYTALRPLLAAAAAGLSISCGADVAVITRRSRWLPWRCVKMAQMISVCVPDHRVFRLFHERTTVVHNTHIFTHQIGGAWYKNKSSASSDFWDKRPGWITLKMPIRVHCLFVSRSYQWRRLLRARGFKTSCDDLSSRKTGN